MIFLIWLTVLIGSTSLAHALVNSFPFAILPNNDIHYSLINSVDFHPQKNLFCASYTHNNKICLYEIEHNGNQNLIQTLSNPLAMLKEPQHSVFSPDGKKIVVANWADQSLNVYLKNEAGFFSETPVASIFFPDALKNSKPHGIAFSPCGKYLVVACGAASYFKNGIALFKVSGDSLKCINYLTHSQLDGIPKGICFSPDGTHILVTFCEPSSLAIFQVQNKKINPLPRQVIAGIETGLSRPEDVKISPIGTYCAISNSGKNTLTFYLFNKNSNRIIENTPLWILEHPQAQLSVPHGIAFSSDNKYLAVTQFGPVEFDHNGDVHWKSSMLPQEGTINLYLLK